jgi:hypothetical protein
MVKKVSSSSKSEFLGFDSEEKLDFFDRNFSDGEAIERNVQKIFVITVHVILNIKKVYA